MRLGVWEVKGAAQRVAEFMVERHADGAEAGPAQPGTVLGAFAGGAGGGVDDDFGEGLG